MYLGRRRQLMVLMRSMRHDRLDILLEHYPFLLDRPLLLWDPSPQIRLIRHSVLNARVDYFAYRLIFHPFHCAGLSGQAMRQRQGPINRRTLRWVT